ncbi:5-formyltetrahydrofolate cyclo-ligase [Leucobacter sp. HY1908]
MSEAPREATDSHNFGGTDLGDTDKAAVRRAVRARRAAMSPSERALATQALTAHLISLTRQLGARRVTCYSAVPHEPDTGPFLEWTVAAGLEVLLPVSLTSSRLDWVLHEGAASLAPGRHGILEPQGPRLGEAAFAQADLVFVPACAVDTQGTRLGWGMGYYDRALARLPRTTPVYTVVFDTELVAALPRDSHDVAVTGAVTPTGIHTFSSTGSAGSTSPDATL